MQADGVKMAVLSFKISIAYNHNYRRYTPKNGYPSGLDWGSGGGSGESVGRCPPPLSFPLLLSSGFFVAIGGRGVREAVAVSVDVGVAVGLKVGVCVGVNVEVSVAVEVCVDVAVLVSVGVGICNTSPVLTT